VPGDLSPAVPSTPGRRRRRLRPPIRVAMQAMRRNIHGNLREMQDSGKGETSTERWRNEGEYEPCGIKNVRKEGRGFLWKERYADKNNFLNSLSRDDSSY